jgi:outer membrane protein OmpA-like peptidoglycan-associated protein
MKMIIATVLILLTVSLRSGADVDHNPLNNGTTQTRNATGHNFEGAVHNPALLGVKRIPRGGLMVPGTMTGAAVWSDKLSLSLFDDYMLDSTKETSALITKIFNRSFDLEGLSPDEVSDKLTDAFDGGLSIYGGARSSLLNFGHEYLAFDISTHFDEEITLPGGPLKMLFSRDEGMLPGNDLDFSDFAQQSVWATDFTFSFGLPVMIPALHDFFRLRYGAGGIGVKYVMGHAMLDAVTKSGRVYFNDDSNAVAIEGEVDVRTAGYGFTGPWKAHNIFENGLPVSGHGIGLDIGGILYDEHATLTINFRNIGMLIWMNHVKEVTYEIEKEDLDVYDIIKGIEEADDKGGDPNDYIFAKPGKISDKNTILKDANGFVTPLATTLNIGYAYSWDFSDLANQNLRYLAEYANASINYEQTLAKTPGRSFIPRFSLGGEAGALHGFLPVRLGFVFGGSELLASAVGAGLNFQYVSLNACYKAVGSPFFIPKRGMEMAVGLNVNWGMSIDKDKDGIYDNVDKCPSDPEDKDGFEDEDGCPDYDNDQDGIPDTVDECMNDPEDKDGFEDEDGCPDYDNDRDEVPDTLDKCPLEPEDRDNYNDGDGCPDFDNDGDNIPDSTDKCPNTAEDIDSYEDEDGCPDYDNDKDGVPDTVDNCMMEPEVFNGYKDEDGCPDSLIRPSDKDAKKLNTKLQAVNFKSGSAELTRTSFAALDFIVGFLQNYETLRYEIQGHTDSRGSDEYNLVLSAARAGTVRLYLLSKGIPEERVIAIGYGESMPIADNKTAAGRAKNRRVQFKIIETNDEYAQLKAREAEFKQKVREAKIKGAQ